MSRIISYVILFSLVIITTSFCSTSATAIAKTNKWLSSDPLSIPLKVRQEQLNKNNLAPNFSFEHGKIISPDSSLTDFVLENWKIIGNNVEWTDRGHDTYTNNDVASGNHAIKIIRDNTNETDEIGDGVQSDFIPVIPGNYLFTYDVRLKNIKSNKLRLGTKLYDAIDIRLLFFDENKKRIDGKIYYPYFDNEIDNSFKGYTFSNFWKIIDFGWANVRARTYNYPFSEGDLPDNCRYVKIFMGLKGEGTMWVDNVSFKYSRWNFTTIERLEPFFDRKYSAADLLIPTPKQVSEITPVSFFSDENNKPIILIPQNSGKATLYGAKILKEKMETIINKDVAITSSVTEKMRNSDRLIFSLGNTNLAQVHKNRLPFADIKNKEQGYFLKRLPEQKNIIFLMGNKDIGNFYAVTTVIQLFDNRNYVYYHADIIDYPDFLGRSFRLGSMKSEPEIDRDLAGIDRMVLYKFNKIYNGYGHWGKDWKHPAQIYLSGLKTVGKKCQETGVLDLAVQVHPYNHFEYEMYVPDIPDSLKYYWLHSNPKDVADLEKIIRYCLDCGATCLMLMADDFVPHEADYRKIYSLWTDEDKNRFVNLQNAQAYMVNEIYDMLQKEFPGTRFEFCPPWYLNEFIDKSRGYAEQYFRDFMAQIPKDIAIIWTGNTVRSLSYDIADIERYRELIGRYPMLWDNTLYARRLSGVYGGYAAYYPGKARMCNIFEPYDIYLPKDFYKYNHGRHIYQNGGTFQEYQKIKYTTVADYEWNNNDYDADFSLWKTLYTQFGKNAAIQLLEFNDNYYGLVSMTKKIERAGALEKYTSQADQFIINIKNILDELSQKYTKNIVLLDELKDWQKKQVAEYRKLAEGK